MLVFLLCFALFALTVASAIVPGKKKVIVVIFTILLAIIAPWKIVPGTVVLFFSIFSIYWSPLFELITSALGD